MKISKFCLLPFISASISNVSSACCQTPFIDEGFDFNSENFKKLRLELFCGEERTMCKRCFMNFNYWFTVDEAAEHNLTNFNSETGEIVDYKISSANLTLGNNCNRACKSCSSFASKTYGMLYENKFEDTKINPFYKEFIKKHTNEIKNVTITGGETTFYQDELEFLYENLQPGIEMIMFSNASFYNPLIEKFAKKFKLYLYISVDSYDKKIGYVRPLTEMSVVSENIKKYREFMDFINISLTVSVLNILDLEETVKYIRENFDMSPIMVKPVIYPEVYSIFNIKDSIMLDKIKTICSNIKNVEYVEGVDDLLIDRNYSEDYFINHWKTQLLKDLDIKDSVLGLDKKEFINPCMLEYLLDERRN